MALKKWNLASVTANTDTDLLVGATGKETISLTLIVTNYSATGAAIEIKATDESNVLQGYYYYRTIDTGETIALDFKIVIMPGEKIRVKSSQANTSFIVCGDET